PPAATTAIYPRPLHDALPISSGRPGPRGRAFGRRLPAALVVGPGGRPGRGAGDGRYAPTRRPAVRKPSSCEQGGFGGDPDPERPDRKSTRLNSSHSQRSYAVF